MVAYVDTCHSFSSTRVAHMLAVIAGTKEGAQVRSDTPIIVFPWHLNVYQQFVTTLCEMYPLFRTVFYWFPALPFTFFEKFNFDFFASISSHFHVPLWAIVTGWSSFSDLFRFSSFLTNTTSMWSPFHEFVDFSLTVSSNPFLGCLSICDLHPCVYPLTLQSVIAGLLLELLLLSSWKFSLRVCISSYVESMESREWFWTC